MKMAELTNEHIGRTFKALNPDFEHYPPCTGHLTSLKLTWSDIRGVLVNEAILDRLTALDHSDELELL